MVRTPLTTLVIVTLLAGVAAGQWYTRPYATRYYKDDWTAQFLQNAGSWRKTVQAKDGVQVAYVQAWASAPYTLRVNGQVVGKDADSGTVEHYEFTKLLKTGDNEIVFNVPGGFEPDAILEGEIVYKDGTSTPIATDATWGPTRGPPRPAGRGTGPSSATARPCWTTRRSCAARSSWPLRGRLSRRCSLRGLLEMRAQRDPSDLLAGQPLDDPAAMKAFAAASDQTLETLDSQALSLMKDGKYEQAEPILQAAHERMAAAADAINAIRMTAECGNWGRHLDRAAAAMGKNLPAAGLAKGPRAIQQSLWQEADKLSQDSQTYLSDPSWSRVNKYGWLVSCAAGRQRRGRLGVLHRPGPGRRGDRPVGQVALYHRPKE